MNRVSESNESSNRDVDRRRVPALVLSGFLGSGKTTLVQRLLADAAERGIRVALISNELGELGIDRALLGQGGSPTSSSKAAASAASSPMTCSRRSPTSSARSGLTAS